MKLIPARWLWLVGILLFVVLAAWANTPTTSAAPAFISLGLSTYTQNFDTLLSTGTGSTVPADWAFSESGTAANTTYTAGTGSATAGDTYSFGAAVSTDRAFGGLLSGSLVPTIGAQFTNATSSTIVSLAVSYTGEQWRLGTTGRTDRIDFQYSTNATSLTTGTWTDVDTLDFTAPVTAGTVGALNGNVAPNQTAISASITGLTIADGTTFWIRWTDFNATGADDGLSVDDFSITASVSGPTPTSTNTPSGPTNTPTNTATVTNTPTATNTPTPAPSCGSPATFIHDIQGSGTASPMVGTSRTIEGIVVGDFQGSTFQSGIYVMEEASDFDSNPATSEGIFVFSSLIPDVNVGDKVRLTANVVEFTSSQVFDGGAANMTEMSGVVTATFSVCSSGNPVTPVDILLPETTDGELEQYEGMLVRLNQTFTVSQNYFLGRYGQVTLSVPGGAAMGRLYHPNNGNGFGDTYPLNARRFITLDDGRTGVANQNPTPVPYLPNPFTPGVDTLRAGDTTGNLVGVIENGKINGDGLADYRLHPTQPVTFTHVNTRPAAPAAVGGTLRVASFNVLNYFNGNGAGGGFPTSRGATTLSEFNRQRTKTIAALVGLNADVVGLLELENDGTGSTSAIQDLVNGLNGVLGPNTYSFVVDPAPGTDEIRVAILYKTAAVSLVGPALNYQTNAGGYNPLFDRPPLAQTFQQIATGERFTYVINHFKSKRCDGAVGPELDTGEGCYNNKRILQAQELYNWIASTLVPVDPDVLTMGDYNAYTEEAPILTLKSAGLTDVGEQYVPAAERYSFVFDGFAGELDHGMATSSLMLQVNNATIWHINADEPATLDYNQDFNAPGYYSPDAFRSSDHDPLLIGLDLRTADYSDSPASYGVAWHRAPHTLWLGSTVSNDTTAANGTDDGSDNGVALYRNRVEVVVTGPGGAQGWLSGWADINNDGTFGADERIVNQLVNVGNTTIPITPLPDMSIRARFRLYESTTEPLVEDVLVATATGGANGGEVEDYNIVPLAAVLSAFDAMGQTDAIRVTWETATESNVLGFDLWRGTTDAAPMEKLNTTLIPAQHPGGQGASYTWDDAAVTQDTTYSYWLDVVDANGTATRYGPVSAMPNAPTAVTLGTFQSNLPTLDVWVGVALVVMAGLVVLRYRR